MANNGRPGDRLSPVMALMPKRQLVDMGRLEKELEGTGGPSDFAPPALREGKAVDQVKTFGELPTKEIDEIVAAARNELESLENDAQAVRDMYVKHTERIRADIERLREGVRLSLATMKELREQCTRMNDGTLDIPGKAS